MKLCTHRGNLIESIGDTQSGLLDRAGRKKFPARFSWLLNFKSKPVSYISTIRRKIVFEEVVALPNKHLATIKKSETEQANAAVRAF
jgi:hypothetical protein